MLNRMVPKRAKRFSLRDFPFGTMSNRMVPKTSLLLFNMIGVDQNRFLGVKQIKSAIAFLANVP